VKASIQETEIASMKAKQVEIQRQLEDLSLSQSALLTQVTSLVSMLNSQMASRESPAMSDRQPSTLPEAISSPDSEVTLNNPDVLYRTTELKFEKPPKRGFSAKLRRFFSRFSSGTAR
jgi:hypothetical protein